MEICDNIYVKLTWNNTSNTLKCQYKFILKIVILPGGEAGYMAARGQIAQGQYNSRINSPRSKSQLTYSQTVRSYGPTQNMI